MDLTKRFSDAMAEWANTVTGRLWVQAKVYGSSRQEQFDIYELKLSQFENSPAGLRLAALRDHDVGALSK